MEGHGRTDIENIQSTKKWISLDKFLFQSQLCVVLYKKTTCKSTKSQTSASPAQLHKTMTYETLCPQQKMDEMRGFE